MDIVIYRAFIYSADTKDSIVLYGQAKKLCPISFIHYPATSYIRLSYVNLEAYSGDPFLTLSKHFL